MSKKRKPRVDPADDRPVWCTECGVLLLDVDDLRKPCPKAEPLVRSHAVTMADFFKLPKGSAKP